MVQVHCCSSGCPVLYVNGFLHFHLPRCCSLPSTVDDSQLITWSVVFTCINCSAILCVSLPYSVLVLCQSLHQGSNCLPNVRHPAILTGNLILPFLLPLWWDRLLDMFKYLPRISQSSHWILWCGVGTGGSDVEIPVSVHTFRVHCCC